MKTIEFIPKGKILAKDLKPGDIISLDFGYNGGRTDDQYCKIVSLYTHSGLFGDACISINAKSLESEDSMNTKYPQISQIMVYERSIL